MIKPWVVDVIISNDELSLNEAQELLESFDDTTMLLIYTDASKQHDKIAAAVTTMTKVGKTDSPFCKHCNTQLATRRHLLLDYVIHESLKTELQH
ncbi:unnamed protein product, partial [Didymodactylos carnosus]